MTAEGEATGAIATTAGKAIDALKGLGGYAAEVFGDAPKDFVGWTVGDRLKARRIDNMHRFGLLGGPLLEGIDPARLSEPSPSVMIPLIAAAADEERAELQGIWAKLLANAAIDDGHRVRREFFGIVRQMEPLDAAIFEASSRCGDTFRYPFQAENEPLRATYSKLPGYSDLAFELSIAALIRLGLATASTASCLTNVGQGLRAALTVE